MVVGAGVVVVGAAGLVAGAPGSPVVPVAGVVLEEVGVADVDELDGLT